MNLQGMSDQQFSKIVDEVSEIQFLIVKSGGMATKTRVEDILMARYGLDRSDARTFTNFAESQNKRDYQFLQRGITWKATRPEPQIEDWPELSGERIINQ